MWKIVFFPKKSQENPFVELWLSNFNVFWDIDWISKFPPTMCRLFTLVPYFIKYNVHKSIVRTWISQWFLAKKLFLFFKNNFKRKHYCKFIHHKSYLKPFRSYLPCIVCREYFDIIFNVKKCTLYSIKYGKWRETLFVSIWKSVFKKIVDSKRKCSVIVIMEIVVFTLGEQTCTARALNGTKSLCAGFKSSKGQKVDSFKWTANNLC
jgi:hypothetical protein